MLETAVEAIKSCGFYRKKLVQFLKAGPLYKYKLQEKETKYLRQPFLFPLGIHCIWKSVFFCSLLSIFSPSPKITEHHTHQLPMHPSKGRDLTNGAGPYLRWRLALLTKLPAPYHGSSLHRRP